MSDKPTTPMPTSPSPPQPSSPQQQKQESGKSKDFPLIFTALFPGIGHFQVGAPVKGLFLLGISCFVLLLTVIVVFQTVSAAVDQESLLIPIATIVALGGIGMVYTGVAVMDLHDVRAPVEDKISFRLLLAELLLIVVLLQFSLILALV